MKQICSRSAGSPTLLGPQGWRNWDRRIRPILFGGCLILACSIPGTIEQLAAQQQLSRPIGQTQVTTNATPVLPTQQQSLPHQLVEQLPQGLLPQERVAIAVYEHCNLGVVHISTRSVEANSFEQLAIREGSGSGSVLDQTGLILTNFHVVDGAREITVSLFNGSAFPAVLVGTDPDTDIAVLKIAAPAEQLFPVVWGDSQQLRVGQRIYAIGNPFGLERSMSTGMISSLNRQIPSRNRRAMRSLIQIDASLNQGNSGGPLLNTRGEQIGMNTAIMSSDGDSSGVGFAIPVSTLNRIVPQLLCDPQLESRECLKRSRGC